MKTSEYFQVSLMFHLHKSRFSASFWENGEQTSTLDVGRRAAVILSEETQPTVQVRHKTLHAPLAFIVAHNATDASRLVGRVPSRLLGSLRPSLSKAD